MRQTPVRSSFTLGLFLLAAIGGCATRTDTDATEADRVRQIERERLRALVDADLTTARRLHADDFQLITPTGTPLTKDEYLDDIAAGEPDYIGWEAGDISVRLHGDLAVIRYKDVRFDVDAGGRPVHRGPMYHTNVYERRGGEWLAVWSQASGVVGLP